MSERRLKLNRRAQVEGNGVDEDYVLVDTHSATLCACNETAWRLLDTLKSGATIGELTSRLTEAYEVEEETAKAHVVEFVSRLGVMGLIDEAA